VNATQLMGLILVFEPNFSVVTDRGCIFCFGFTVFSFFPLQDLSSKVYPVGKQKLFLVMFLVSECITEK